MSIKRIEAPPALVQARGPPPLPEPMPSHSYLVAAAFAVLQVYADERRWATRSVRATDAFAELRYQIRRAPLATAALLMVVGGKQLWLERLLDGEVTYTLRQEVRVFPYPRPKIRRITTCDSPVELYARILRVLRYMTGVKTI